MVNDVAVAEKQLSWEEQLFEAAPKGHYYVNQAPSLINMAQNLSLIERRVIYPVIALVQPDDTDFKTYVLRIKDLADLIGYKGKNIYQQVEKAIDGIMKKQIVIYSTDGKQKIVDKIQWVERARYMHGEGVVHIQLSRTLSRYLLNLEHYVKYQLMHVLKLGSEYSWRIYELLKEYEWRDLPIEQTTKTDKKKWKSYRIIKVSELRRILEIDDDKYTEMSNFKAVVLNKAKKELKEKTDIVFDFDTHKKKGRNIDSFIFYINKNDKKSEELNIDSARHDVQSFIHLLIRHEIRRDKAIQLVEKYNFDYLDANIRNALVNYGCRIGSPKINHELLF
ncbi:replication initiation protein [Bacillus sp. BRMEA1]|uniref:replication initiation protein n=1 Tax=Neobacillus endophyticus TaxID=2738405 RepID=UPI0015643C8D|nr:replication initiation protein [Neobacillus endophyticus]NRD81070.1 replication initiation protein [Neobacillus endophyticus]